ncbi:MAG: ABC transporter permease [Desulfobacteraceae bacterium]|nr:ABC transporter permease [Desulfobacteraceae bacterium]
MSGTTGGRPKEQAYESSRLRVNSSLIIGGALVSIILAIALVSFLWTPYDPSDTGEGIRLGAPSTAHWTGTDKLGRDLFTQLMIGARLAFVVAIGSTAVAGIIGITLGLLAASAKTRIVDESFTYFFDVLIAFPTILMAMLVVTIRGASISSAILAIGISGSAIVSRLCRISATRILGTDYVKAAIACGTSRPAIVFRHVLPNIYPLLLVQLTLVAAGAILAEASLAYLGLGAPPPQASWGRMLLEAQGSVMRAPWGAIVPGLTIVTIVMGFNFLGDGIRELLDPEMRKDE